jgi:hypothetical protein
MRSFLDVDIHKDAGTDASRSVVTVRIDLKVVASARPA